MKSQVKYTVSKDKGTILAGVSNAYAVKLAQQAGDPLYDEYVKCKEKLHKIREKIRQKYGRKALNAIKKSINK